MAKAESVGSDKGELKRLLKLAVKQPVHMAFALGADGKAVVKLDKMKQPRALEKSLKDDAPDAKNHRFGTIVVDEADPKLAKFIVNKAVGGFARKLVVALKGTGFRKVQIVLEDGSAVETHEEDDEEEDIAEVRPSFEPDDGNGAGRPYDASEAETQRDGDGMAGQAEATAGDGGAADTEPAAPDAGALTRDLTGLVRQMLGVIAKDPTQKALLAELATDVQASIKRGDLEQAAAGIEILRDAIDAASSKDDAASAQSDADAAQSVAADDAQTAVDSGAPPAETEGPPAKIGDPAFAKARQVWLATRKRVEGDVDKLHAAMSDVYKDHGVSADLTKFFRAKVDPILNTLDESLAHKLDEVTQSTDPAEHKKLVAEAQRIIQGYEDFLASEPSIALLDNNPFVPLTVEKTLTATLAALSKVVS